MPLAPFLSFLSDLDSAGIYPPFHAIAEGVNEPVARVDGRDYLQFSANNYLSLSESPAVKAAAASAIARYGLGPGGARVISGTTEVGLALEAELARWTGTEDALTFPTGYMANVSVIRALSDPVLSDRPHRGEDGVVFLDELVHGSLVDGAALTGAKIVRFRHADPESLRRRIKRYGGGHRLIVTEGVFSLEGEMTDLHPYLEIAHETGSLLLVDDAHGVGLLGERGSGTLELQGIRDPSVILMGSMDKALGGIGGFLAGSKEMIRFLRVACRSSLFSSALPVVYSAALIAAIQEIEAHPEVRRDLFRMAALAREALRSAGFTILGGDVLPAIPVLIGEEERGLAFSAALWERSIFCPLVRFPAVPKGKSRLRVIVMARHTEEEIGRLVGAMVEVREEVERAPPRK